MRFKELVIERLSKRILGKYGYTVVHKADNYNADKYLDSNEFQYILTLDRLFKKIERVPGHIIELGVARGRNAILFGSFIRIAGDQSLRQYYGFDTFSGYTEEDLLVDKHLDSNAWKNDFEFVKKRIERADLHSICRLIKGDIVETVPNFIADHQDMKIALVYVDCNAYRPALSALNSLKNSLSPGAVICVDEHRHGGETRALLEFCEKENLTCVRDPGPFSVPAYVEC